MLKKFFFMSLLLFLVCSVGFSLTLNSIMKITNPLLNWKQDQMILIEESKSSDLELAIALIDELQTLNHSYRSEILSIKTNNDLKNSQLNESLVFISELQSVNTDYDSLVKQLEFDNKNLKLKIVTLKVVVVSVSVLGITGIIISLLK